jgi:hypothetical protein
MSQKKVFIPEGRTFTTKGVGGGGNTKPYKRRISEENAYRQVAEKKYITTRKIT